MPFSICNSFFSFETLCCCPGIAVSLPYGRGADEGRVRIHSAFIRGCMAPPGDPPQNKRQLLYASQKRIRTAAASARVAVPPGTISAAVRPVISPAALAHANASSAQPDISA